MMVRVPFMEIVVQLPMMHDGWLDNLGLMVEQAASLAFDE